MDGFEHYSKVRTELVKLYEVITQRHFSVIAPRSVFFTTEQLERIARNPPPGGVERFTEPTERGVTIEKMVLAYEIGGDDFELAFKRPKRDIPEIYETIQEYIRLWVDIKINSYGYKTATIEELRKLENVARSLFGIYRYYYELDIEEKFDKKASNTEFELANMALAGLAYGNRPSEISFISYIDHYQEKINAKSENVTVYIDKDTYVEPSRQPGLTEVFDLPNMQHNLGNWQ